MKLVFALLAGVLLSSGVASATPRLQAGSGPSLRSTSASVEYLQEKTEPVPTRIVFGVPDGYSFTPDANGAGIGSIIGDDVIDLSTEPHVRTGVLTLEDARAFETEGLACTGSAQHDAAWALSVDAPAGGAFQIPIFVDGRTFAVCPDAVRLGGTPTAIALGLGLVGGTVDRPIVTGPARPGRYVWIATVSRPGVPDVEVRSIVDLPQRATFTANGVRGQLRVAGRVTANGRGVGGVRVQVEILHGSRNTRYISARTRAAGRFAIVRRLTRGIYVVRLRSEPDQRDVTASACGSASGACVSATKMIAGMAGMPAAIRVRVR